MVFRLAVAVVALPLCLSACASSNRAAAEKVVVTTNPSLVEKCEKIGPVSRAMPNQLRGDELLDLQTQALAIKANTVLIRSITATGSGSAFSCDPALPREANLALLPAS